MYGSWFQALQCGGDVMKYCLDTSLNLGPGDSDTGYVCNQE